MFGIVRDRAGQSLERDLAMQAKIPGAVDLTHAAGAERRDDLVGAEAGAGGEGHWGNLGDGGDGGAGRTAVGTPRRTGGLSGGFDMLQ